MISHPKVPTGKPTPGPVNSWQIPDNAIMLTSEMLKLCATTTDELSIKAENMCWGRNVLVSR